VRDEDEQDREGERVRPRAEIEALNSAGRELETGGASHTQQRTLMLEVLLDIRELLERIVKGAA